MSDLPARKVGIVACSGEELAEGTVTRLAALKVLDGRGRATPLPFVSRSSSQEEQATAPLPSFIPPSPWTVVSFAVPSRN